MQGGRVTFWIGHCETHAHADQTSSSPFLTISSHPLHNFVLSFLHSFLAASFIVSLSASSSASLPQHRIVTVLEDFQILKQ